MDTEKEHGKSFGSDEMETELATTTQDDLAQIIGNDLELTFRKTERPFRFAQSKHLLLAYGLTSFLVGLAIFGAAIAEFALMPEFQQSHSFHIIENKWSNIIAVLSGLSAIGILYQQTLPLFSACLFLSLVCIPNSLLSCILHAANFYFRQEDVFYYEEKKNFEFAKASEAVGDLNLVLAVLSLVLAIVSFLLHRYTLTSIAQNFGFRPAIDKHRFRLAILGLVNLVAGMLITAWWISVEILFSGNNIDSYTLPTSEIIGHGMILAASGYLQMMATSKGTPPILAAATALSGIAFLLVTYYCPYPLSLLYFVMDYSEGNPAGAPADIKMALAAFLTLIYMLEVFSTLYSFMKLLQIFACEEVPEFQTIVGKYRKIFTALTVAQPCIGATYLVFEILAISLFFLYKLDFNPLPVLLVVIGILMFSAFRESSPLLLSTIIPVNFLAMAFCARDVYLFVYHTTRPMAPDSTDLQRSRSGHAGLVGMSRGSLAVHFLEAIFALSELAIAISVTVIVCQSLWNNTVEFRK